MARKNPIIESARLAVKDLGIQAVGWGYSAIIFIEPKIESLKNELQKKMGLLGLRPLEDEADKEAGMVTYVDNLYKEPANPFEGQTYIGAYASQKKHMIAWSLTILFLLVPLAMIFSQVKIDYIICALFFGMGILLIINVSTSFTLENDRIIYKNIFRKKTIPIKNIRSIKTRSAMKSDERIVFELYDGNNVSTSGFNFIYAGQVKKVLQEHVRKYQK